VRVRTCARARVSIRRQTQPHTCTSEEGNRRQAANRYTVYTSYCLCRVCVVKRERERERELLSQRIDAVSEFAHVSVGLSYMQCVLVDVLECLRLLCFCIHTDICMHVCVYMYKICSHRSCIYKQGIYVCKKMCMYVYI
jgi:hypothetical protein